MLMFSVTPTLTNVAALFLVSAPAMTQELDFGSARPSLNSVAITRAFDCATICDQFLRAYIDRSIKTSVGTAISVLSRAKLRVNNFLAFDEDGQPVVENTGGVVAISEGADAFATPANQDGTAFVGILQYGAGAHLQNLKDNTRSGLAVLPEQFYLASDGLDWAPAINRAIKAAANWPTVDEARRVHLSRFYRTDSSIEKPSFVRITGDGPERSGLKPTISSGYALTDLNSPGKSLTEATMSEFGIDGINMTGTAGGLLIDNEQQVYFDRVHVTNVATGDAVRIVGGSYNIHITRSAFRNNKRHMVIGTTNAGASDFPTTIYVDGNIFEGGLASMGEAIFIEDAMVIMFTRNIFQSNLQKTLFNIKRGAGANPPRSEIKIQDNYFEDNTNAQVNATLFNLLGNGTNKLSGVSITGNSFFNSGSGPIGRNIRAFNTSRLVVKDNAVVTTEDWLLDLAGNLSFDIDATRTGKSDLQSIKYTESNIIFGASGGDVSIIDQSGFASFAVARNATGNYTLTSSVSFHADTALFWSVSVLGSGATMLAANAQPIAANQVRILTTNLAGAAVDPEKVSFTLKGRLPF